MGGQYSKIGEKRLKKILDFCKKQNVFLAVENINNQVIFEEIFKRINHDYLKFCYDSGHNHCFDNDFDYLTKYGDKLVALHLHDGMEKKHEHTLNRFGTIDWDNIAFKLAKLPPVNLDYELLMISKHNVSAEQTLKEGYQQGKELEKMIEKYRLEAKTNSK